MENRYSRIVNLIGEENLKMLRNSHVAVFGIGGVGGYAAEALCRSGVGTITLVDSDVVEESNLNRQIIATIGSLGTPKTEAMKTRILSIDASVKINAITTFFNAENAHSIDFSQFDYVIDAIDTVTSKIFLIEKCKELDIPIISSMGTGNKLNPAELEVSDIYKTSVCPLAKVMRYELKKRGVKKLKVVYSKEEPIKPTEQLSENGRHAPASMVFVPAAAGMILASEVVKDLLTK